MEQTLVILKPSGTPHYEEFVKKVQFLGLQVKDEQLLVLNEQQVRVHYHKYEEKPFFPEMLKMMEKPVWPILIEGSDAIHQIRENVLTWFRGLYASDQTDNALHASDPDENPAEECERFFGPNGIVEQWRVKHPGK